MRERSFLLAVFLAVLALALPEVADACAVCLTGAAPGDPTADAFNWSVLFLMATPYTVVGSVAGWLVYTHWRAAKKDGRLRKKAPLLRLAWIHKESGK
ncbi:hypothetical protein EPO44_17790 [bacterium]|nr:MAG: hypothetical protein EPO44_17790 [bacterium]